MENILPAPPTPPKFSSSSSSSNSVPLSIAVFNSNNIPPWSTLTAISQSTPPLLGEEPRSPAHNVRTWAKKTSIYRGVTRHKSTGSYEAHLWEKDWWDEKRQQKGRQVYIGAYKLEKDAAHAYDLAALKYWGLNAITNFPMETYAEDFMQMQNCTMNELLASIRRRSSGFVRGVSRFRGVSKHHQNGRWEARIGRVKGKKYLYLGSFGTEEEAAKAYDIACLEHRGPRAVTNYDANVYIGRPQQAIIPLQIFQQQQPQPSPVNLAPLATIDPPVQAWNYQEDINTYNDVFKNVLPSDLPTENAFDQCSAEAVACADEAECMLRELLHKDLFDESTGSFLLAPELNDANSASCVAVAYQGGCNVKSVTGEGSSSAPSS